MLERWAIKATKLPLQCRLSGICHSDLSSLCVARPTSICSVAARKHRRPVGDSQPFKPPILFFCPEASFVGAEADSYGLQSLSLTYCASVVRGMPPPDSDVEVLAYPGCWDACLVKEGKLENLRERAVKAAEKYGADKEQYRKEEEEQSTAMSASVKSTFYNLADCQDSLWGWASLTFRQLQVGVEECNSKTLNRFREQCILLEELDKRRWYNERMGWRK